MMNFKRINGKLCNFPFLYLRERNTGRDVVDLLSMKTPCSNLTEHGCNYTYEERIDFQNKIETFNITINKTNNNKF